MSNFSEEKQLIMVGSTGTVQNDGTLKVKSGGLYDKIVYGHQFAKTGRKYSWPAQMKKEEINNIITDDGDYCTVHGITVFTPNRNVLNAATSQGKLLTR